jgi:hypothetical protein
LNSLSCCKLQVVVIGCFADDKGGSSRNGTVMCTITLNDSCDTTVVYNSESHSIKVLNATSELIILLLYLIEL